MHEWAAIWKDAGQRIQLQHLSVEPERAGRFQLAAEYKLPIIESTQRIEYTVRPDGSITIDNHFTPGEEDLPDLPRFGMQLRLPASLEYLSWLGRGPHETYWDRKTSGAVGLYRGRVWDQIHRYSRPQETGNKTDVHWMALRNRDGAGLMVRGDTLLSASAWPFAMEDLDFAAGKSGAQSASGLVPVTSKHGADLAPRNFITWNIDLNQMGVGGDTSWGRRVHKEYTLPARAYRYRFTLTPVD